ncbi:MarR family winged helix-turn-helix transcriptional regulator [Methylomonas sp. MgM2]
MKNLIEPDLELYDLFDNLAALIRAEERKKCVELGLQPIHLQILNYLFRANDYNNTPGATASYLGITRGPASQSLIVLEKKGLVEKVADPEDRRLVHLRLLPKGIEFLKRARPVNLFKSINSLWKKETMSNVTPKDFFRKTLIELQKANASQAFGTCKNCQSFSGVQDGFYCRLIREPLSQEDSEKICQDYVSKIDATN